MIHCKLHFSKKQEAAIIEIDAYLHKLINELKIAFGTRLIYVGLQGSYGRNEASESSDIDIVVILDELQIADMDVYRQILIL